MNFNIAIRPLPYKERLELFMSHLSNKINNVLFADTYITSYIESNMMLFPGHAMMTCIYILIEETICISFYNRKLWV